jgi:hypothetical protein
MTNFSEVRLKVDVSYIRRVKIQYFEHTTAMGLFSGVEFYDANGAKILTAGRMKEDMVWFKYLEFQIEENERIVGVKSGRRGAFVAHHFDL